MKSKIWLITGISSGLGKALAKSVIEKGDFVIGTFRKQSQVDEFNEKYSNRAFSVLLDIIDEQSIERNVEKLISKFERIDVLVNNVETPDIVYHPRRVKVTIAGRTKVTHPRRAKVTHL